MSDPQDATPAVPTQSRASGHLPAQRAGPTLVSLVFRSPLFLAVFGAMTFLATLLLLEGTGYQGEAIWRSRGVWLWHVLMAFWPVFLLASIAAVFDDIKGGKHSVWPDTRGEQLAVVLYTAIGIVMSSFTHITYRHTLSFLPANLDAITLMPGASMKNTIMSVLGSATVTLHLAGLVSVHVQLIRCSSKYQGQGKEPEVHVSEEEVLRYLRLRSQLSRFLGFISAIIGLTILHMGAFRDLLSQSPPAQPALLPASFLMAYGILFTVALACAYLPVHKTLTDVGEVLANRLVRNSIGTRATWKEWSGEQKSVRAYLGLQGSALHDVQQGISVLAPLLASISTLILGVGG